MEFILILFVATNLLKVLLKNVTSFQSYHW